MDKNDTKRLSRLTAILIRLQTKRLSTALELADYFSVSVRTIYRDIKALEQAGVPISAEDGKGFALLEGYNVPPVMFTEAQANALITAEQLVLKNKDTSFIKDYKEAVDKIKAVLKVGVKDKANLLSERIQIRQNSTNEKTSSYLSDLQFALTNFHLAEIKYANETEEITRRIIEPFALYSTQENWLLVAFCRLRKEYRAFRLDRIKQLNVLDNTFEPHTMTMEDYFEICRENYFSKQ